MTPAQAGARDREGLGPEGLQPGKLLGLSGLWPAPGPPSCSGHPAALGYLPSPHPSMSPPRKAHASSLPCVATTPMAPRFVRQVLRTVGAQRGFLADAVLGQNPSSGAGPFSSQHGKSCVNAFKLFPSESSPATHTRTGFNSQGLSLSTCASPGQR